MQCVILDATIKSYFGWLCIVLKINIYALTRLLLFLIGLFSYGWYCLNFRVETESKSNFPLACVNSEWEGPFDTRELLTNVPSNVSVPSFKLGYYLKMRHEIMFIRNVRKVKNCLDHVQQNIRYVLFHKVYYNTTQWAFIEHFIMF